MSCACGRTRIKARGLCGACYQRFLREQPASLRDQRTPMERFNERVSRTSTCWIWTGTGTPKGYGQFSLGRHHVYAHRWAYEALVGPIADGMTIDHLCEVKRCVNPQHMEVVTRGENTRRALLRVRPCEFCGHSLNAQNLGRHMAANHADELRTAS